MIEIPVEHLRNLFDYDPGTGHLRWKKRDRNLTGKIAGGVDPGHGYRRVRVCGHLVLAHRVIMAMTNGEWPSDQVDHINGDRDDNRLANLRCVTRQENLRNKARYANNTSGHQGVYWHTQHQKWLVDITTKRRRKVIGLFDDLNAAIAARKVAEVQHHFHQNHGRD